MISSLSGCGYLWFLGGGWTESLLMQLKICEMVGCRRLTSRGGNIGVLLSSVVGQGLFPQRNLRILALLRCCYANSREGKQVKGIELSKEQHTKHPYNTPPVSTANLTKNRG